MISNLHGYGGFVPFSWDQVEAEQNMLKALATNATYGTSNVALMPEDLEPEAHNTLWANINQFPFLAGLPSIPATNDYHEYARILGFGRRGSNPFYAQNGLGRSAALRSERTGIYVKAVGEINEVTGMAGAVLAIKALGVAGAVASQRAATLLSLTEKLARAVYFSDNRAATTSSDLPFKGLLQHIIEGNADVTGPLGATTTAVVDMRGYPCTKDTYDDSSANVTERWGRLNHIFMAPMAMKELEKDLDPQYRLDMPRQTSEGGVVLGTPIRGLYNQAGFVQFHVDPVLSKLWSYYGEPMDSDNADPDAPATPSIDTITVNAGPQAGSLWIAADAHATIKYKLVAVNDSGESVASVATAGDAVAATDSVTIAWTGSALVKSYKLYRNSSTDQTHYYMIKEIVGGAGGKSYIDLNQIIPGCTMAFGVAWNTTNSAKAIIQPPNQGDTVRMVKLSPMHTLPLATITDTAAREMIKMYCGLEATHPNRLVAYINVGNRT